MIAISYRREDSLPITGRLYDRLQAKFGKQNVFMDFDSIPAGVDFRERIKQTIERSELVVAVIGPRWLGEQSDSSRRIDEPTDFVRLEIKYALEQGIPVIPLLVDNTLMPKPEKLPPEIERLAFRNALPLDSGLDFHNHADRIINSICALVGVSEMQGAADAESKSSAAKKSNKPIGLLVAVGVLVGAVLIGSWYLGFFQNFGKVRSVVTSVNESQAPRLSAATETPALSAQSAPVVKAGPIYKGIIRTQGEHSGSGIPLTINLSVDRKSGTMTQTTKSGDTVVKFNGVWDGMTLRAVTDAVIAKPNNSQWKPESFTLRFAEDWKRVSYECNSEGSLYTAELSPT
jgi:TIR domain